MDGVIYREELAHEAAISEVSNHNTNRIRVQNYLETRAMSDTQRKAYESFLLIDSKNIYLDTFHKYMKMDDIDFLEFFYETKGHRLYLFSRNRYSLEKLK